jgi:hypothetical protein
MVETWSQARYAAPVMPLVALVLTTATAVAASRMPWRRSAGTLAAATAGLLVLTLPLAQLVLHVPQREAARKPWSQSRARIARELNELPGRHLVFVRYSPDHSLHREWVYNAADLEGAKVLWVRALGRKVNAQLAARLADRQAWVVNADDPEPHLLH